MRIKRPVLFFGLQVLIYAALVAVYLVLVLHLLSDWILEINHRNLRLYAGLALLLIIAQGFILEAITTFLVKGIQSRMRE